MKNQLRGAIARLLIFSMMSTLIFGFTTCAAITSGDVGLLEIIPAISSFVVMLLLPSMAKRVGRIISAMPEEESVDG